MHFLRRAITTGAILTLIASSFTSAIETNLRVEAAKAITTKQLPSEKPLVVWKENSVTTEQKAKVEEMKRKAESAKWEYELRKKAIIEQFESEKKSLQSEMEGAKKTLYEEWNALDEEAKKLQKWSLEVRWKELMSTFEARKKELQARFETAMKALKEEYEAKKWEIEKQRPEIGKQSDTDKKELEAAKKQMEEKKKSLMNQWESEKKALQQKCEARKKEIYDAASKLTEEQKKENREYIEQKFKELASECEAAKKVLWAKMEENMKSMKAEYETLQKSQSWTNIDKKKPEWTSEKSKPEQSKMSEKDKQSFKDKLSQVKPLPIKSEAKLSSEELAMCKSTQETMRKERDANLQMRKAAWDAFWEYNKWVQKEIYEPDAREDVKDIMDTMRLQLRLIERKYARSLVGTASVAQTPETVLNLMTTIVNKTRDDLAWYVIPWKEDVFNAFRDEFTMTLLPNKSSLLVLIDAHAKLINALPEGCKNRLRTSFSQSDSLDRTAQWQMNTGIASGETNKRPPTDWFEKGDKPTQN